MYFLEFSQGDNNKLKIHYYEEKYAHYYTLNIYQ